MNRNDVCEFIPKHSTFECIEGADNDLIFCSLDENKTEEQQILEAYSIGKKLRDRVERVIIEMGEYFVYLIVTCDE